MISTLKNAWSIPELRKKLIFTALILLVYRVGNVIPVPYIDVNTLGDYFNSVLSNTILGLYNAMSGSAFSQGTVLALSIQPYINASIIIQLLTVAIPALERIRLFFFISKARCRFFPIIRGLHLHFFRPCTIVANIDCRFAIGISFISFPRGRTVRKVVI